MPPPPPQASARISLVLRVVSPHSAFVVVAGDWPGALVTLLCLNLHVTGAFFPRNLHQYFKPINDKITPWQSTPAFQGVGEYHKDKIFLFSGSINFLRRTLPLLKGCGCIIVAVEVEQEGASCLVLQQHIREGHNLCATYDLRSLVIGDPAIGGATNAQHFFGFGHNLDSLVTPVVEPGLRRTVRNVLDGVCQRAFHVYSVGGSTPSCQSRMGGSLARGHSAP